VAQSAALAEKFHYMCYALATYGQAAVAIFHFLREGKKLCVWGWFVRPVDGGCVHCLLVVYVLCF